MGELITVQVGSFANFVGAHYWNLQDEAIGCCSVPDWSSVAATCNSEVVCMWSEDRHGGATYAPRAVAVDLTGSLGAVTFSRDASTVAATAAAAAAAAAAATQAGIWAGAVEMHRLGQAAAKSKYRQQLETAEDAEDADAQEAAQQALEAAAHELHAAQHTPKYWTDFLQVDLQHESVLLLSGGASGPAGGQAGCWAGWGPAGSSSSAARDLVEAAVDRARWWAEQCDSIQGLQLLADDLTGWGGICHSVLQELRDQYPSTPLLYFSLQEQQQQQQQAAAVSAQDSAQAMRWLLGNCISLAEVPQLASLYVPMSAAHHVAAAGAAGATAARFQAAAVLAAAIDTATLPLRCTGARSAAGEVLGATDLHSLVHLLSGPAANFAAASLQLPTGRIQLSSSSGGNSNGALQHARSGSGLSLSSSSSLTQGVSLAPDHCLAESLMLRGAWGPSAAALAPTAAAKQALESLLLQRQQEAINARCVVHSCISPLPVAVPLSFPASLAGQPGATTAAAAGSGGVARPCLPRSAKAPAAPAPGALTRLTATSGFQRLLQQAARDARRLGATSGGQACLDEWGYASSDVDELREVLLGMAGKYEDPEGLE